MLEKFRFGLRHVWFPYVSLGYMREVHMRKLGEIEGLPKSIDVFDKSVSRIGRKITG
jgi:hypothetical protein